MKKKKEKNFKEAIGEKFTPMGVYTIVVVTAFLAGALWIYITGQLSYNSSSAARYQNHNIQFETPYP